jgi:hypothetical protein
MQTLTSQSTGPYCGCYTATLNGDFVVLALPKDSDSPYCPSLVGQPCNRKLDRATGPIRECFAAEHG